MSFFRFSACTLLALGLAVSVTPGCSRQAEGERCSLLNGNQDCQSGVPELFCTSSSNLRNGADGVDRCCPEASAVSDARCTPRVGGGTGGDTGSGGSNVGGQGGASGTGGNSGIGAPCDFNSDCIEPLVCGPTGVCQVECREDRDCSAGLTCSAEGSCVSAAGGASN